MLILERIRGWFKYKGDKTKVVHFLKIRNTNLFKGIAWFIKLAMNSKKMGN